MKGIFMKVGWVLFFTVAVLSLICGVWGAGEWLLTTFPTWLLQIILGVNLFLVIIVTAFLLALGITKFMEIGKNA